MPEYLVTFNKKKLPMFDKPGIFGPNNVVIQRNALLFNLWKRP